MRLSSAWRGCRGSDRPGSAASCSAARLRDAGRRRRGAALLAPLAALALALPPAHAALPGRNGDIAFIRDLAGTSSEVFKMHADGTGQTNLTNRSGAERRPVFSPGGGRIAFQTLREGNWEIYTMDVDGARQTNVSRNAAADDFFPSFSPDGRRIVFSSLRGGNFDIYVMNADGSGQTRLTADPGEEHYPTFSPDGTRIIFMGNRSGGRYDIYLMNADGSGLTNVTDHPAEDQHPTFSADGRRIAFETDRDGNVEIYAANLDGSASTNLTRHPSRDLRPSFSPDGTRMAWDTNRDGNREIYTMNVDGTGQTNLTRAPRSDDFLPHWGPRARPPRIRAALPRPCAAGQFSIRLSISGPAAVRNVSVRLDGRRIARTDGRSFRVRVAGRLRAGRHRLTVTARDAAGNRTRRTFGFRACAA